MATDFVRLSGGKAANRAFLARRLGHPAWLLARVGGDDLREQVLGPLRDAGVDPSGVSTADGIATAVSMIAVMPDGKKTIVLAANANDAWDDTQAAAVAARIAEAPPGSVLTTDCEVPQHVVAPHAPWPPRAARGLAIVIDPSPAERATTVPAIAWRACGDARAHGLRARRRRAPPHRGFRPRAHDARFVPLEHGLRRSSLSSMARAGALARLDPEASWRFFEEALRPEHDPSAASKVAEGAHLGARSGRDRRVATALSRVRTAARRHPARPGTAAAARAAAHCGLLPVRPFRVRMDRRGPAAACGRREPTRSSRGASGRPDGAASRPHAETAATGGRQRCAAGLGLPLPPGDCGCCTPVSSSASR